MNQEDIAVSVAELKVKSDTQEKDIVEIKSDIKEIKTFQQTIYDLTLSVRQIAEQLTDVKENVHDVKNVQEELKNEISELQQAPIKMKACLVDKILWTSGGVIGMGILTYILSKVIPEIFG